MIIYTYTIIMSEYINDLVHFTIKLLNFQLMPLIYIIFVLYVQLQWWKLKLSSDNECSGRCGNLKRQAVAHTISLPTPISLILFKR